MVNIIKQELPIEESDDIYVNSYSKRIKFKDSEQYIKSN
jgi:hypothetical protein